MKVVVCSFTLIIGMFRVILYVLFLGILLISCAPEKKETISSKVDVNESVDVSKVESYHKEVKDKLSLSSKPLNWVQGHNGYVYYMDISPDGKLMVSGGSDKFIRVWDISKLPEIKEIKSVRRLYQALWGPPVRFSEDGNFIFSGSYDFIEVFDKDLNFIDNMRVSDKGIQSIEVSGGYVYASDVNGFVYKFSFDGKKLKLEDKKKIHNEEIWKVKSSHKGKYILTASLDKTAKVLDSRNLEVIQTLRAHAGPLEFIDSSENRIAIFSADSYISVWDYSFNLIGKLFDPDRKDIVVGIFDKTSRYIISGGKSFKVRVWDIDKMSLVYTLEWHNNDVMAIRITPNNNFIITGDRDGKIAIWGF